MNDPRIGDVVHYVGRETGECHRAVVLAHIDTQLHLRAAHNDALGHFQTVAPPSQEDHTPGTWHHTH